MFCPNCGGQLPDGCKFCSICGANLSECTRGAPSEAVNTGGAAYGGGGEGGFTGQGVVRPKKQFNAKKLIGLGAIAAVILLVVLVGGMFFSSMGKKKEAYVCLSDGTYELMTNLKNGNTVEIASARSDSVLPLQVAFSPDGKYVYYYTKYDPYKGTATLCRAEFGKLKADSSKNEKYIEVIATNILPDFRFLDNGMLLYQNEERTLYCYDGIEEEQVAKSVEAYYTDESDRIVYYSGDNEDGYTMYGVSAKNLDDRVKLAANFSRVCDAADFDHILYTKKDDDGGETLYVVGFEKDSEKLGGDVNVLYAMEGVVYYTAPSGDTVIPYDYVTDDYADADAGLKEPELDDYAIPSYRYKALNSYSDPEDYGDIYTTCSLRTQWSYRSLQDLAKNDPDHREIYQGFVDKYLSQENEEGYIFVTDAIRNDLDALVQACGDGYDGEWLELCFYKEEYSSDYDRDAYEEDYEKYNEAKERIRIREELSNPENTYPLLGLHCYNKGTDSVVSENVLSTIVYSGGIMYNTTDLFTELPDMESIAGVSGINSIFEINYEAENYMVVTESAAVLQMSAKAAQTFGDAVTSGYASLYVTDQNVFMSESSGGLSVAAVNNGAVERFSLMTDDAVVLGAVGSVLYYGEGIYTNNGYSYCDLYTYRDGKENRLAKDVMANGICLYSDGVILAYTGYKSYSGYELAIVDAEGKGDRIGDEITDYIRIGDSEVLFISDNDLYYYNGKEKTRVKKDVDAVWSMDEMEVEMYFGFYGDGY